MQERKRAEAATRFRLQMPPIMNARPDSAVRILEQDGNLEHFSRLSFAFVDTSPGLRPFVCLAVHPVGPHVTTSRAARADISYFLQLSAFSFAFRILSLNPSHLREMANYTSQIHAAAADSYFTQMPILSNIFTRR